MTVGGEWEEQEGRKGEKARKERRGGGNYRGKAAGAKRGKVNEIKMRKGRSEGSVGGGK